MSKKNKEVESQVEETAVDTEIEEPVHKLTEDEVEVLNEAEMRANCPLLNIRKAPAVKDNIAAIVPEGTLLIIDENYVNNEWAKVVAIPEKVVGRVDWYCMKKFLA